MRISTSVLAYPKDTAIQEGGKASSGGVEPYKVVRQLLGQHEGAEGPQLLSRHPRGQGTGPTPRSDELSHRLERPLVEGAEKLVIGGLLTTLGTSDQLPFAVGREVGDRPQLVLGAVKRGA